MKPYLDVVGAAIVERGRLFSVRRGKGSDSVIHKFEFVGGKIAEGESGEDAIVRECMEELDMNVEVVSLATKIEYEYPDFVINLSIYFCRRLSTYTIKEHEECRWIPVEELDDKDWAPADAEAADIIKNGFVSYKRAETERDLDLLARMGFDSYMSAYEDVCPENVSRDVADAIFSRNNIEEKIKAGCSYDFILLNGEIVGFYSSAPTDCFDKSVTDGVFLTYLSLISPVRDKHISTQVMNMLPRPVTLVVGSKNAKAIAVFGHFGFRVISTFNVDVGGHETSNFVMELK